MKTIRKLIFIIIIISVISSAFCLSASAGDLAYGAATVAAQTLNLRTGPGLEYSVVATMCENDIVVVLEKTNDEWYYINSQGIKGYANAPYFKDVLTAENFNAIGCVAGDWVYMRSTPSTSSKTLGTYSVGTTMTVIGINNGWYKVKHDGHTGYMRSDNMEIVPGYKTSSTQLSNYSMSSSGLSTSQQLAEFALSFVGCRYVLGGTSPSGFDCSGLTYYAYKNFGYTITRRASTQYANDGVPVSKSELVPGDLVFFSSNGGRSVTHVGIYIGDDEFVHASTSSTGVIISRLDSTYYTKVWYGAKRVIS